MPTKHSKVVIYHERLTPINLHNSLNMCLCEIKYHNALGHQTCRGGNILWGASTDKFAWPWQFEKLASSSSQDLLPINLAGCWLWGARKPVMCCLLFLCTSMPRVFEINSNARFKRVCQALLFKYWKTYFLYHNAYRQRNWQSGDLP